MKWKYEIDGTTMAQYITVGSDPVSETVVIREGYLNLDLGPDGKVVGVEILK